jgi:hypothetical protein
MIINKYSYNNFKVTKISTKIDFRLVKNKKQTINIEIRNYKIRINALNFLIYEIKFNILHAVSIINQYNTDSD